MHPRATLALRIGLCALLLLWGGYTLITYLGVPAHGTVLLTEQQMQCVPKQCGWSEIVQEDGTRGVVSQPVGEVLCAADEHFCRGMRTLWFFLSHSIGRMEPVLWYGIGSLVVALLILGWVFVKNGGDVRRGLTLSPLSLLGLSFVFLWLIFTAIGLSGTGTPPLQRLYEPLPQVYVNASPQLLETLQEDFEGLQERGCLTQVARTTHGANVYDLTYRCMLGSFFTRVLPQAAMVLAFLLVLLTLGRAVLSFILRPRDVRLEALLSCALGAGVFTAFLWLTALLHAYTKLAGWLIPLLILGIGYRHAWYWLRQTVERKWTLGMSWQGAMTALLGWLLLSYLAFNFLNVVRPFPIGWDDLGRYLNLPRLLVSYGHIIPSMGSFLWEYLTSLGFLLFGYDSTFGAIFAMEVNWTAGLLATFAVWTAGSIFFGRGGGLLSALLYYTLPLVGHFSFADMKVDNAMFFMASVGALCTFLGLFPVGEESSRGSSMRRWLLLGGLFCGFAFGMKVTAVMMFVALLPLIPGVLLHWSGFLGTASILWMLFGIEGRFSVADVSQRVFGNPDVLSRPLLLTALFLIGAILLIAAILRRRDALRTALVSTGIFVGSFIIAIAPWLLYNNISHGNVIPRLALTLPDVLSPSFPIGGEAVEEHGQDVRRLPKELAIDPTHPACKGTSKEEELDRYWGYGSGWGHYLTLPWRSVMNLDSVGYYVTTVPFLLLFPLLLLLPFFWSREGKWLRYLFASTLFVVAQWVFFANGVPWYGIVAFFGLCVGLESLVMRSPDGWSRSIASVFLGLSLLISFSMRFWQYESQRNIFEYALGEISAEAMEERTIQHYDDIRTIAMDRFQSMPDRPYVFRVGTFIPYFIPRNLEVLPVADNQLGFFNCLYQEKDSQLTLQRMKALGFNSIIFDTNTHTIEKDPNGSLHKKVNDFIGFLNDTSLGLQVHTYDPEAGVAFVLIP